MIRTVCNITVVGVNS